MAFRFPNEELAIACRSGDLPAALAAMAAGAWPDRHGRKGASGLQEALGGALPSMAIDLQIEAQRLSGKSPWRGADGQNAASLIGLAGLAALMPEAAARIPASITERDADGRSPFDLFCERCCVGGVEPELAAAGARAAGPLLSLADAESAIASCEIGFSTCEALGGAPDRSSPLIPILEALCLALSLPKVGEGSGARRL